MYRCTCSCSARALEAFIANVAGISISIRSRPQRLQRPVRGLHTAAQTERTIDAVTLRAPASSQTSQSGLRLIEVPPVLEPAPRIIETGEKAKSDEDQAPARPKAESRMLRKLKRIQNGSHNKSAQSKKLVDQVGQMLEKIEDSPQILAELVSPKKEKEAKTKEERPRRSDDKGKWIKGKWVRNKPSKTQAKSKRAGKQGVKGEWAKARKEDIKEKIANERAGEKTVDVGDEAEWEHIQDDWTDEPVTLPKAPTETKKNTRKERGAGKHAHKDDASMDEAPPARPQEPWGIQKSALERKFGEKGWQPRKRLSPDTLSGIRALHASNPTIYNVEMLHDHFKVTPEAIRRILKSKWRPSSEEIESRMQRWERRGVRKWSEMAEQGQKPPKKWRALGVPNPKLGKRKEWDSNTGVARSVVDKKQKMEEAIMQEKENLMAKSRRMENAHRMRFKESLAGRIL